MTVQCKKSWRKRNKKCEIVSDANLEMPKGSQELLGFRILNFEPESEICHKFKEFILFGDILWQKCRVVSKVMQCYVIIAVDFNWCCLIGLPFL